VTPGALSDFRRDPRIPCRDNSWKNAMELIVIAIAGTFVLLIANGSELR
jgi:hypothetical protein